MVRGLVGNGTERARSGLHGQVTFGVEGERWMGNQKVLQYESERKSK